MAGRLENTKALITGGGGAIGLATARAFLTEGASVFIADLDRWAVDAALADLRSLGEYPGAIDGDTLDVTDSSAVDACVARAAEAMGGLSALINNAGTVARGPLVEMPEADIDRQIAVNIKGVILCSRAAIAHLRQAPNASITSTSSQAGKRGWADISVYGATKAAVLGFSRAMAMELAPAIRVNSICPGHIGGVGMAWRSFDERKGEGDTVESFSDAFARDNVPLGRLQSAEDIAAGFVYLTSMEAKEITGAALNIGGGVAMD